MQSFMMVVGVYLIAIIIMCAFIHSVNYLFSDMKHVLSLITKLKTLNLLKICVFAIHF